MVEGGGAGASGSPGRRGWGRGWSAITGRRDRGARSHGGLGDVGHAVADRGSFDNSDPGTLVSGDSGRGGLGFRALQVIAPREPESSPTHPASSVRRDRSK